MKTKKIIFCLLILITVSSITIFSYAKYTESSNFRSSAKIAKWSFLDGSSNTTISLVADTAIFENLKPGKIAPGTYGEFEIMLDASGSDVGVDYEITITPQLGHQLPTGLVIADDSISGTIDYNNNPENMKKSIKVSWEWTYGSDINNLNYDEESNIGYNNHESNITTNLNVEILGKQQRPGNNR